MSEIHEYAENVEHEAAKPSPLKSIRNLAELALEEWEKAKEKDSNDAEYDAAIDMADALEEILRTLATA